MSRQRITQRPANTFGKTADLYLMNNEDRKQPSATDYMNGDPSAWAEDVRPAPKPGTERDPVNGLPLLQESNYTHRNSEEWGDDGKPYDNMNPRIAKENARLAMRQVHAELSRNASLALRVAEIMLRNAPTSIVEAQALDLMSLSHSQIQATLERLAGQEMDEDEDEDHDKDAGQEVEEEEVEEASKKKASKKAPAKKSKKASEDEDEDHDKDAAKKHAEDHEDEDESKEASEDEDEDEDHTEEANKKASVSPEKLRQFMANFQQLKEENARLASQVKAASAKAAKAAKAAKVASVEEEIERDLDALLKEHEASEDALDMGMLGEEASMDDSLDAMMDGDDMMDGILFEDDVVEDMEDPFFMSEASAKTAGRKPVQSLNQVTKTAGKLDDEIRDLQKLWASDPQID